MTLPKCYYLNTIGEYYIQIDKRLSINSSLHLCNSHLNIRHTFHVNKIVVKEGRKTEGDILSLKQVALFKR